MTGREQKVYYSYSQMTNKHSVPDEGPPSLSTQDQKGSGFALPELEHNLQLLIDLTEQDILQVRGNQKYHYFLCTTLLLLIPHADIFNTVFAPSCSPPDVCSMKKM